MITKILAQSYLWLLLLMLYAPILIIAIFSSFFLYQLGSLMSVQPETLH